MRLLKHILLFPVFGCSGGGGAPAPVVPAPVAQAPQEQDAAVVEGRDNERARRRAASSKTIRTSSQGVTDSATTQGKQLLGQ